MYPFFDGELEPRKATLAKGTRWPRQAGAKARFLEWCAFSPLPRLLRFVWT